MQNKYKCLTQIEYFHFFFQYPKLSVDTFHTTYTYLNTILDGEQPLVVSSKHTVTNTVTAPDDYLSLLKPSETRSALKDTNTYYSTIGLEKTLYEGNFSSVISTSEIVTQVIITESVPPKATSVMTSYIALDMQTELSPYSTTDVVKTYFVTYTYYNTVEENGIEFIHTNISTSSDIVTEKIYIQPKKSTNDVATVESTSKEDKKKHKIDVNGEKFKLFATKTFFTTFTYLTTMVQEGNKDSPTIISSSTKILENLATETIDPDLLDKKYLELIKDGLNQGSSTVVKVASLQNGQKIEVTAILNDVANKIQPSKVLPIEKTQLPEMNAHSLIKESSNPNIVTGSTIVFIDDDPFAQLAATPVLNSKSKVKPSSAVNIVSVLGSEVVEHSKISTAIVKSKKPNKRKSKTNLITPTKSESVNKDKTNNHENVPTKSPENDKKQGGSQKIPTAPGSDLLGLGSININSLQALTPVLNAMAGLITTNLKSNRRSDINVTVSTTPKPKPANKIDEEKNIPATNTQNRSPIYIPVGGLADDFEIAESQNIATFDWIDPPHQDPAPHVQATHETSLLNGGIPISPGDIITANSDVIVGKPGRVGPRIPSIPLSQNNAENDVPVGMKPPPIPGNHWPKQNHEYKHIPLAEIVPKRHTIIHSPNNNDYIGPPPPPPFQVQSTSEDRIKPIVLLPPSDFVGSFYNDQKLKQQNEPPSGTQIYAQTQNGYYLSNDIHHDQKNVNFQEWNQNFKLPEENPYAVYTYGLNPPSASPSIPLNNNFNIQPSVVNEPIEFPEIIERSTGQPLLVNLQPSQVAYINIPFNRTTALIYGGSTEPHRNGQYFDDPSPYPDHEYSGLEIKNAVPHTASFYQNQLPNQKQVNGVIKVGNQVINKDSAVSENQKVQVVISPTKTYTPKTELKDNNHQISLNVPPISFGLVEHGNDFNAHVINHENFKIRPPITPYDMINNNNKTPVQPHEVVTNNNQIAESYSVNGLQDFTRLNTLPTKTFPVNSQNVYHHLTPYRNKTRVFQNIQDADRRPIQGGNFHKIHVSDDHIPILPQYKPVEDKKTNNRLNGHQVNYKHPNKPLSPFPSKLNVYRPKPLKTERPITEYMTPPLLKTSDFTKYHRTRRPISNKPLPIPLSPNEQQNVMINAPHFPHIGTSRPVINSPEYSKPIKHDSSSLASSDFGDHTEDDFENEDGEVIQESNSRPLFPGEVPFEILKSKTTTTTTQRTTTKVNNKIRFPPGGFVRFPVNNRPVISNNARPFVPSRPLNKPILEDNIPHKKPLGTKHEYSNPTVDDQFSKGIGTVQDSNVSNKKVIQHTKISSKNQNNVTEVHTNPLNKYTFVNQPTNKVMIPASDKNEVFHRIESKTTNPYSKSEHSTENVFGSKTKLTQGPTITTVTQKPIFIFIDESNQQGSNFFHHKNKHTNKIGVTSLPIDSHTSNSDVSLHINPINTQTEKPFVPQQLPPAASNEIIIKDEPLKITTKFTTHTPSSRLTSTRTTSGQKYTTPKYMNQNSFKKKKNASLILSDLEIMRPPPLVTEFPLKQLNSKPKRPQIQTDVPISNIFQFSTQQIQTEANLLNIPTVSSHSPTLIEKLVSPPEPNKEDVLGINPPPAITTLKPYKSSRPAHSTQDISINNLNFSQPSSTSTEKYDKIRTRRPYTRKPTYFGTLTTKIVPPKKKTTYESSKKRSTTEAPTSQKIITPSPTLKVTPSMEVIIGHPSLNSDEFQSTEEATKNYEETKPVNKSIEIVGSEIPIAENKTETALFPEETDLYAVESGLSTPKLDVDLSSETVHHSGNQVKIVDEFTTSSSSKTTVQIPKTRKVLPIRYITHTKTSTITVTRTTVVKSLGQPPSTLTILVTKTETTAVIETVTEVRTVVKPTGIVETITTTVRQASSLYPPEVYGSPYPSVQVKPTQTQDTPLIEATTSFVDDIIIGDDLEDFIIHNTDPPISEENDNNIVKTDLNSDMNNKDTIFVIMTDKNTKNIIKLPDDNNQETQERDEVITTNQNNNILLGGILIDNRPEDMPKNRCEPECKASKNELCHKIDKVMRCVCRLGFARMFPDRPCLRKYSYTYLL